MNRLSALLAAALLLLCICSTAAQVDNVKIDASTLAKSSSLRRAHALAHDTHHSATEAEDKDDDVTVTAITNTKTRNKDVMAISKFLTKFDDETLAKTIDTIFNGREFSSPRQLKKMKEKEKVEPLFGKSGKNDLAICKADCMVDCKANLEEERLLFVQMADTCIFEKSDDGNVTFYSTNFFENTTAFTDIPFRNERSMPTSNFFMDFNKLWPNVKPNAAMTLVDDDVSEGIVVSVFASAFSDNMQYGYRLWQSDEQKEVKPLSVIMDGKDKKEYAFCSLFIDDVITQQSSEGSVAEEVLGLKFLSTNDIAEQFTVMKDYYFSYTGLVNFNTGTDKSGLIEEFTNSQGRVGPLSYDEFKRACVTKCANKNRCNGVGIRDNSDNANNDPSNFVLRRSFTCLLVDTTATTRGVNSVQLFNKPMTDPLGLPFRQNTEIFEDFNLDYPFENDFVYVKKESAVTYYDSSVCKVDILRFKESLACAGFSICVENYVNTSLCADNVLPEGFKGNDGSSDVSKIQEYCDGLIGKKDDDSHPQPDFWSKLVPGPMCLLNVTGSSDDVGKCIDCLQDQSGSTSSDTELAFDEATGIACVSKNETNPLLGECKDKCGGVSCVSLLQQTLLCLGGSYQMATNAPNGTIANARTRVLGGAINTNTKREYACP